MILFLILTTVSLVYAQFPNWKDKESEVSYLFYDLDAEKVLFSEKNDQLFTPGSVAKIPTALFALEQKGADFRVKTQLGIRGESKEGLLKGDLFLKGEGDPSLFISHLQNMVLDLKHQNIKKISGSFFYDDSIQISVPEIAHYFRSDQTYNPGVSALSFQFNRVRILNKGKGKFTFLPELPSFQVNRVSDRFSKGIHVNYVWNQGKDEWEVSKKQRYSRVTEVPVKHASRFTAEVFRDLAIKAGIEVPLPQMGKWDGSVKLVSEVQSAPLLNWVIDAFEYSNNLIAELLLLNSVEKKKIRTTNDAAAVMEQWWKNLKVKGSKRVVLKNGSGLHPQTRVSADFLVDALTRFKSKKYEGRYFSSLLSSSGWSGWMEKRLREPSFLGRVWAKTGSLDYVSGISGYLTDQRNHTIAFAILMNDFDKRKFLNEPPLDDLLRKKWIKKAHRLRVRARSWKRRAVRYQDQLLKAVIEGKKKEK
ncbi:MAG: D-alanyl-D-alanine carboxypeptidase/D-alanyl-D-alanine-endopeptidase [Bdellovibrionaceae bacterium]|nr:D-alanyl-D-alanine carboxypeptidase/D-alanyl-D-alanine-endopeptidase [Pseudobdellovibrionaceae bacterium]|tara:strand:+ start:2782 stop:4209 length:1428 start_codon:yes stop_codon:yes gene_type:complete